VAGNEDLDGDVSGEEAAWRDLVARFELPVDTEAEQAPWPARENLTESARDRQRPDQDAADGWEQPRPGGRAGPASLPARPGAGLRPEAADEAGAEPQGESAAESPAGSDTAPQEAATAPKPDHRADRPRIIRRAGPGRPDQVADEDEDEDDRYIPPPPDPLPPLDPVAKGAWAGVLGGPGYLLIARLADWYIPPWAALVAIVAFVGGFATLVVRMRDQRDDDDDGAVV
jgi:hypothetical protein